MMRVCVTGIGAVSAAGTGAAPLLESMLSERSAIAPSAAISGRAAGSAPVQVRDRTTRRLDRAAAMFVTAAREAWQDAGLEQSPPDPEMCAVIEGSSLGPLSDALTRHAQCIAEAGAYTPRPSGMIQFMTGSGGTTLAHLYDIRGPVLHLSAGSVSSMVAIGEGCMRIARGEVDVAVVGGAECPLHPIIVDHFEAAGILTGGVGSDGCCRPFDRRRSGTVLGEGAGVLIIESEDHARRRGAHPLALIHGFGLARETGSMTAPDPRGAGVAAAARQALAAVMLTDVGWIKAHGTGTRTNDAAEVAGLAEVFGAGLPQTPITSLKSTFGHALGASGAVETVAAALALGKQLIPPTLGTEEIDETLPRCSVALRAEKCCAPVALVLAEGFGGRCAALALGRA
jgi:3-oxoacyl-[acyl-carrier-protein] synthase II